MKWLNRLLSLPIIFCAAIPSAALAGQVEDIQAELNQSRQQTMAMLTEKDHAVLEMRYDDAIASSKAVDASLQRALTDPALAAQHGSLETFKQVWDVFKTTRDDEIVPLLLNGKQNEAKALAQKEQLPRFKQMNDLLDIARSK
jgi:predicted double-glycine peptidase